MGIEVSRSAYTFEEQDEFSKLLKSETIRLKNLIAQGKFSNEGSSIGLELEGWLVNNYHLPTPLNQQLIDIAGSEQVVKELSRYNFEINGSPQNLNADFITKTARELSFLWSFCRDSAREIGAQALMAGTAPSLSESMLNQSAMSPSARYTVLDHSLRRQNNYKPFSIDIEGRDHLDTKTSNIMLASAGTSLQIHYKTPISQAGQAFNIAQLISGPILAASANTPLLFGRQLWRESRIPLFESILGGSKDSPSEFLPRAHVGHGFVQDSITELFDQNLQFPVLIPELQQQQSKNLFHLQLHNGTIWRWNRPVLGCVDGEYHMRTEMRALPSGPTLIDVMANVAMTCGLMKAFLDEQLHPEHLTPFIFVERNFYNAAKRGLEADMVWVDGNVYKAHYLLLNHLLPTARKGLEALNVDPSLIEFYIDTVFKSRVEGRRTGAQWQIEFMEKYGRDFRALTEVYLERQESGLPVSYWSL